MTRKIFLSILTTALAVLLASIFIIMGGLYDYFGGVQERQLEEELLLAATGVENGGETYLDSLSGENSRLTWIAADGTVLYDGQADPATMENHAQREEVREALETGSGKSSRYSATLLEKTVYCATRLSDGTVLRISVSHATMAMLVMGMLQPMVVVALAAFVLAVVLAKRISKRIVAPLNQLDLDHPLDNDAYDELAPLLSRIQKQHEQIDSQLAQLRQKTDEFQHITANMKESLVLLNDKGRILSMNPAACTLFGVRQSQEGQDFLVLDRTPEMSSAIAEAWETGHTVFRRERGSESDQFDISRIEEDGKPLGLVLLAFDVSAQADAERSRREFTANVSHELKTPLTSILASAELIENGLVKDADLLRFIGHIHTEASRLLTLIEDIIRLSQLDEGGELPSEPVDLAQVAREAAQQLESAAQPNRIQVSLDVQSCTVQGVPRLLHEIAYNLIENAIKYNVPDGTVQVTVRKTGSGAELRVADTGIGIPAEHQDRVFERFYRVDKSHSKQSGGTGLGLSIVKHAAAYSGAQVRLQSEPGKGTVVTVTFPG